MIVTLFEIYFLRSRLEGELIVCHNDMIYLQQQYLALQHE